jgi:hypothetical protein
MAGPSSKMKINTTKRQYSFFTGLGYEGKSRPKIDLLAVKQKEKRKTYSKENVKKGAGTKVGIAAIRRCSCVLP